MISTKEQEQEEYKEAGEERLNNRTPNNIEQDILYNLRLHLNPYDIEGKMGVSIDLINKVVKDYIYKEVDNNSKLTNNQIADITGFSVHLVRETINARIKLNNLNLKEKKIINNNTKKQQEIEVLRNIKKLKDEVEYKEIEDALIQAERLKVIEDELFKSFADLRQAFKYDVLVSKNKIDYNREMIAIYEALNSGNKTKISLIKEVMQVSGKVKEDTQAINNNYTNILQILNCDNKEELNKRMEFIKNDKQ